MNKSTAERVTVPTICVTVSKCVSPAVIRHFQFQPKPKLPTVGTLDPSTQPAITTDVSVWWNRENLCKNKGTKSSSNFTCKKPTGKFTLKVVSLFVWSDCTVKSYTRAETDRESRLKSSIFIWLSELLVIRWRKYTQKLILNHYLPVCMIRPYESYWEPLLTFVPPIFSNSAKKSSRVLSLAMDPTKSRVAGNETLTTILFPQISVPSSFSLQFRQPSSSLNEAKANPRDFPS